MQEKAYRAVPLEEVLAQLPAEERAAIDRRAQEMQLEDMTLRDLRRALNMTQQTLARTLEINQVAVSALERRSDMLLSTLRSYIEAMGGRLELVARFPGRPDVRIQSLADHPDETEGAAEGERAGDPGADRKRA